MTPETPNSKNDGDPIALTYAGDVCEPPSDAIAMTALVLGIVSVTIGFIIPVIIAVIAILVSVTALIRIQLHPRRNTGRRPARIGLVLGTCGLIVPTAYVLRGLNRGRELANRSACHANLRSFGKAIVIYAEAEPNGAFPDDLDRLMPAGNVSVKALACPSVSSGGPCYHYVPGYSLSSEPDSVVMYEMIDNHGNDGGNVLYQDGHVLFLSNAELQNIIDDNKDRAK